MNLPEIETALRKIAEENGLTYVSFDLHVAAHRTFFSCKAHRRSLAKSGIGSTLDEALQNAIADEFNDTAPGIAEDERIMAAGRAALEGRAAA